MLVKEFDPVGGCYHFQMDPMETDFHAHPALEIIRAVQGSFDLETLGRQARGCRLAIVGANISHRLVATEAELEVVLVEKKQSEWGKWVKDQGWVEQEGLVVVPPADAGAETFAAIMAALTQQAPADEYDPRVEACIAFLETTPIRYDALMANLKQITGLSASRISRLFSNQTGISPQRFMTWCRLKQTILTTLETQEPLLACALDSGFYDQAHFGRAFKQMMGISPARIYNSRIVQA